MASGGELPCPVEASWSAIRGISGLEIGACVVGALLDSALYSRSTEEAVDARATTVAPAAAGGD